MDFAILAEELAISTPAIAQLSKQRDSLIDDARSLYRYLCALYWRVESIDDNGS